MPGMVQLAFAWFWSTWSTQTKLYQVYGAPMKKYEVEVARFQTEN
jgi:hypothetical protein